MPAVRQQSHGVIDPATDNLGDHHQCRQNNRPAGVSFGQRIPLIKDVRVPPVFRGRKGLHVGFILSCYQRSPCPCGQGPILRKNYVALLLGELFVKPADFNFNGHGSIPTIAPKPAVGSIERGDKNPLRTGLLLVFPVTGEIITRIRRLAVHVEVDLAPLDFPAKDKLFALLHGHFCLKCTFSNSILPHRLNAVFCTGFLLVEFTCQDDLAIGRFKIKQELPIF